MEQAKTQSEVQVYKQLSFILLNASLNYSGKVHFIIPSDVDASYCAKH